MFNSDPKNEGNLPKPTTGRPSGASRTASPFVEPAVSSSRRTTPKMQRRQAAGDRRDSAVASCLARSKRQGYG